MAALARELCYTNTPQAARGRKYLRMTETFTLAQISDLHISPLVGFTPRYWNAKRMLGYANWRRKRRAIHQHDVADRLIGDAKALRVDHIAITGDLVNLGLPAEHDWALNWLARVGPPDHVTVVPGNHDIYSAMRGDKGVARWAEYMGGEEETLAFPFVRRVGPLALIGLNSAIETPPFVAEGKVGGQQVEAVGTLLERLKDASAIRVVLIHHPPLVGLAPPRRALRDAPHLVRALERDGAELVLYGHNHKPLVTWLPASAGAVPVVGAASGSAGLAHKDEPLAQYNLFTFFRNNGQLRIRHTVRGLETPEGPVTKLRENILEAPANR